MGRWFWWCGAVVAFGLTAGQAGAEEVFSYSVGVETPPPGETEAYVWVTQRDNKGVGTYRARDYTLEVEHGITDRLEGALNIDAESHTIVGAQPLENGVPQYPDVHRSFAFSGVRGELKWLLRSPQAGALGVAVYIEPGYHRIHKVEGTVGDQIAVEAKLILEQELANGRLKWAANLSYEQEFEREPGTADWGSEAELEVTGGLAYRLNARWWAGLEARYASEYPGFPSRIAREHYAVFLGPTLHFEPKGWSATLTWLPQIYGAPHDPLRSTRLHLIEHEKSELRLKVGVDF